jgi:mRNA interferase MazF
MFGEVIICQFPFSSGTSSKIRPALVLFDFQWDAIICRVTSVPHFGPLDVAINDWQAAGLLKPSVARLDRIITAEKTIFMRRLGVLASKDLEAVRIAWNQHMKL